MNDAEPALQGLHDIVLPAPVSWMPQTLAVQHFEDFEEEPRF